MIEMLYTLGVFLLLIVVRMLWFALVGLLLGGLIGYGIAYARFGDAKIVTELREQYKSLHHEHDTLVHELNEYKEQNRIVKYRAQQLLQQNEDYAKIVSQLSRYHYHLQQAAEKVQELNDILGIDDDPDLDKKIMSIERRTLNLGGVGENDQFGSSEEKKFF